MYIIFKIYIFGKKLHIHYVSYLNGDESRADDQLRFRRYKVGAFDGPPAGVEYARYAIGLCQQCGVHDGETEADAESRNTNDIRCRR